MKIGIMGGTFDPIHNGHLMLGQCAYQEYALDSVWFMPNGNPPHKQDGRSMTDAYVRAEMVKLAIQDMQQFRLEDYEIKRNDISYSYETMEHFKKEFPQDHFYFIIGADSLLAIESWVHPERIFPTCTILAAYRDEMSQKNQMQNRIDELNNKYKSDIRLLNTPLMDVASHELREKMHEGKSISRYIPKAVEDYIISNKLYES